MDMIKFYKSSACGRVSVSDCTRAKQITSPRCPRLPFKKAYLLVLASSDAARKGRIVAVRRAPLFAAYVQPARTRASAARVGWIAAALLVAATDGAARYLVVYYLIGTKHYADKDQKANTL